MKNNEIIGYLVEYHAGNEEKEPVRRSDLTSEDKERQDLVKSWAYGLAEPWSPSALSYIINYVDYKPEIPEDKRWIAQCDSIFYDFLESVAIANGSTPEEALKNAKELVEYVVDNFYEKDEDCEDE